MGLMSFQGGTETFKAYYQQNYKWTNGKFIRDNESLTSSTFTFQGNQLIIDKATLTITNRIVNSNGDYMTARSKSDPDVTISVTMDVQTDAKGRKFKCLTVERPKYYKIVYYIQ